MLAAGLGVGGVVLVITVHGDNTEAIGPVSQEPAEGIFQGCTLTLVDRKSVV